MYFEVDSFLPVEEKYEFLRKSCYRNNDFMGEGFRLKTQRFRGQISQGLALPLSILPGDREYSIGEDVTMYWKDRNFGVCGRNYEYRDDGKNAFWEYAKGHGIEEALCRLAFPNVAIQGEFCGGGIQKNRLCLKQPEWYVFTMIDMDTGKRYPLEQMQAACEALDLAMVPVEEIGDAFAYDSVDVLLERARGKYPSGHHKEGIVIRPQQPEYSPTLSGPLSMKVINNDYLLK